MLLCALDSLSLVVPPIHSPCRAATTARRVVPAQVLNKGTLRDSTVGSATRALTEADLPLLSQGDGIWHELTPEGSLQCKVELLCGERASRALRERDGRSSDGATAGTAAAGWVHGRGGGMEWGGAGGSGVERDGAGWSGMEDRF